MSYVPYQIDYQVKGAGKTLGLTKKKVTFKFGFANDKALADGFSGSHCRGSEHEVVFIWSLNTGKRQILVDNKEAHFSETGQNGWTADRTFQHHFNVYSPNYGTIRCHLITLPPNHDVPGGNRPFQLRVNGVNFFDFCQIFQLGTPAMIVRPAPAGMGARDPGDDPYAPPEERQAIAKAKLESLRDLREKQWNSASASAPPAAPPAEASLISFDDPAPPPQGIQNHQQPSQFMSSVTMDASFASPAGQPYASDSYGYAQPAPTPYSNYTLDATPAPQYQGAITPYGQQSPAASPYAQAPAPYAQAPAPYAQAPAPYAQAPAPYAQAPAPYAQAPASYAQAPAPYAQAPASYAQAPAPYAQAPAPYAPVAPSPQQTYGYGQAPAAPAWNYGQQQADMNFAQPSSQLNVNTSAPDSYPYGSAATPQSQVSYGSAPSFAQPPRQQQPGQYGGY